MNKKTFNSLRELREHFGYTQQHLADLTGFRRATIAEIEAGKNVTVETLQKISEVCNCCFEYSFKKK